MGAPRREECPMVRLVFIDMDDTFVAPDKTIPRDNLRILDDAAERGVQFVPCTGRSLRGVPRELLAHPSVCHAVCGGGALVYDVRSGRIVREVPIDRPPRPRAPRRRPRPARRLRPLHPGGRLRLAREPAALRPGRDDRGHAPHGALAAHLRRLRHRGAHRARSLDLSRQRPFLRTSAAAGRRGTRWRRAPGSSAPRRYR